MGEYYLLNMTYHWHYDSYSMGYGYYYDGFGNGYAENFIYYIRKYEWNCACNTNMI